MSDLWSHNSPSCICFCHPLLGVQDLRGTDCQTSSARSYSLESKPVATWIRAHRCLTCWTVKSVRWKCSKELLWIVYRSLHTLVLIGRHELTRIRKFTARINCLTWVQPEQTLCTIGDIGTYRRRRRRIQSHEAHLASLSGQPMTRQDWAVHSMAWRWSLAKKHELWSK